MNLREIWRSSLIGAAFCAANGFALAPNSAEIDLPGADGITIPVASRESTTDLLSRIRAANEELYSTLQSFVCNEQIERFKGSLRGTNARHIDTVTTKVSFENGVEHYTDILQDNRPRTRISSVSGAWSEGEFGTLLQQTQLLMNTQSALFRKYTDLDGIASAIYQVDVCEQNSPWVLEVEHHHYRIPFRTEVWVSQATGQILKIERVSTTLPSRVGISEMRWGVTLHQVQLDQKTWLLPKTGNYSVLYEATGRREWNELKFSEYHRYGSEVALRFQ